MKRVIAFGYGVVGHVLFLGVYGWLVAFLMNLTPGSVDTAKTGSAAASIGIDLGLIALFGLQHSIMARPWFKEIWTRVVPKAIERSTYVYFACAVTGLVMWQWRSVDDVVWDVHGGVWRGILYGVFAAGVLMVPGVSLLINHFDLLGTRQVWLFLRNRPYTALPFRAPMLYRWVRHPLYVGWMIMFWSTPRMTVGHVVFAAGMTVYILVAVVFEERNLVAHFGREYELYQQETAKFLPLRGVWRFVRLGDWTWWAWAITAGLLVTGIAGNGLGFIGAMVVTAVVGGIMLVREGRVGAFSVQLRVAYLALLGVCYWPTLRWLYWLPAVGTVVLLCFGYCLMARLLSLLPWNGGGAITMERLGRTFFSAPDLGRAGAEGGCAGGVCSIAAQVAPQRGTGRMGAADTRSGLQGAGL